MKLTGVEIYQAKKLDKAKWTSLSTEVAEEIPLTIFLNGKEIVTVLCSPIEERYLALGFLVSEGMIGKIDDLTLLNVDEERGIIWVEADHVPVNAGNTFMKRCLTACCGRGRADFYFANDVPWFVGNIPLKRYLSGWLPFIPSRSCLS